VALTDGLGDYEVVNIDVQNIRINYSGDEEKGWISLGGVKTESYDILRLVKSNRSGLF
jgi:hypothetical protein